MSNDKHLHRKNGGRGPERGGRTWYVPVTPGGTPVIWGASNRRGLLNAAQTEAEAWKNLMADAAHMPYADQAAFEQRGYTIERWENFQP